MDFNLIAQTNLQLFRQLQEAGYDEQDLIFIHQAYQFGSQIFTGFFRGSGKPFLSHLVGTASILVSLNASIEIIAGGLLHAAYELGDFGDGGRGITPKKQYRLRKAVGEKVENYVARYTALKWNQENIIKIYHNLEKFNQPQKEILLIRLANELEDYHDRGVLYCTKYQKRLDYLKACSHLMVEMAEQLGYPQLSISLDKAFKEAFSEKVLPDLQNKNPYSYVLNTSSPLQRFIGQRHYRLLSSLKRILNDMFNKLGI